MANGSVLGEVPLISPFATCTLQPQWSSRPGL